MTWSGQLTSDKVKHVNETKRKRGGRENDFKLAI
jgi:hypothetical protein